MRSASPGRRRRRVPEGPEREFSTTRLSSGISTRMAAAALDAISAAYAAAGVTGYAVWVHESDAGMRALERRGYRLVESTRRWAWRSPRSAVRGRRSASSRRAGRSTCGSPTCPRACSRRSIPPPSMSSSRAWTAGRRSRDRLRRGRGLRDLQRRHPRARPPARARHRRHRGARARRALARVRDGEPAIDADGRAHVRGGRLPRPRPVPRVRLGAPAGDPLVPFARRERAAVARDLEPQLDHELVRGARERPARLRDDIEPGRRRPKRVRPSTCADSGSAASTRVE